MKGKFGILMVIAAFYPLSLAAEGICSVITPEKVVAALDSAAGYSADVRYAVSLPSADNDIVYSVRLQSEPLPGDTVCEAEYLIDWLLPRQEGDSEGFLAYLPGEHYRYRDHRLQEYHWEWDSIPFQAGRGGVQRNGQFVDMLPQMLARQIRAMLSDSTFSVRFAPDTLVSGRRVVAFDGVQRVKGFDGRYFKLFLDPQTLLPLRIYNEYNPGQISEQSVTADFTTPAAEARTFPDSEEALMALYPEVFEKYRESNYRAENLRGLPMPAFALPTVTGERYTHHKGDPFLYPTVIALLDPTVATTGETVRALRRAVDTLPGETSLIMAFTGSNADTIEEITGQLREGEAILMSARSLARDCGVNEFPAFFVAGRDGKVREVILGFNPQLTESVIQSVTLAN